ncbi:hypothetical protein BpHYR1_038001 [Brachionus plicatilis]|uniref:Uncharacterized protein n=1 Tax=Brachionus plicatilis TaxID=10195 RepID=A0A3M7QZN4_BRAPC|nr:hypothetical protein BpHYR1_038001 [Brachionus plicatilis]
MAHFNQHKISHQNMCISRIGKIQTFEDIFGQKSVKVIWPRSRITRGGKQKLLLNTRLPRPIIVFVISIFRAF